ncbi:hypothetical protein [Acidithiobacillus sp.]|uniref:hypothetical protein n=1 Tax=Acidithiobacillus sp. TaxID=1872118 RepID=UPI00356817C1
MNRFFRCVWTSFFLAFLVGFTIGNCSVLFGIMAGEIAMMIYAATDITASTLRTIALAPFKK